MEEIGAPAARVARGVVYTYFQNIVGVLATLIYFPILVRILSREEVGLTVTLGMVLALMLTLNSFSIPKAVTKYVAEYMGKRKFGVVRSLYKKSIQLSLDLGGASAMVLLLFSSVFFSYFSPIGLLPQLAILLSIDIVISTLSGFLGGLLYGLQKFRRMAIIGVLSNILRVGGVIALLYLGYGVPGVIAGWIIGDVTGMLLYFSSARKAAKAFTDEDDGVAMSSLFKYSLPLYGTSILGYLSTYIDRFLLLGLIGLSQLAVYSAAVTASSFLEMISYPISYVLFPFFSELHGKKSNEALQIASLKATRYTSLVFVPIAVGLATVSYPATVIFAGAGYTKAAVPLAVFCLTMAFTQLGVAVTPILLSLGRTTVLFNANMLGIVTNTVVVVMLAPLIGINGVALGRAGLMVAGFGYSVYLLRRSHGFYIDKKVFTKVLVSSLIMGLVVVTMESFFSYNVLLLPIYILVGAATYFIILRHLKLLDKTDFDFFRNFLPTKFHPVVNRIASLFSEKPNESPDRR